MSEDNQLTTADIRKAVSQGGFFEFCVYKPHQPQFPVEPQADGSVRQVLNFQERIHCIRVVHKFNMFYPLSEQESTLEVDSDGKIWYGAKIRAIAYRQDRLPDDWEKSWQELYLLDGVTYFAEPKAFVRTVTFNSDATVSGIEGTYMLFA